MRLAVLLLSLLSLFSCVAEDDGVLSVATAQEPTTQDVMVNASVSGRNILVGNVYERLFGIDEDGGIIPLLAEDYTLSEDSRELSVSLRGGVMFHDGSRLDTGDAVASLNRWLSVYANARAMVGNSRFHEEDGRVVIKSESPIALLPLMLASSPQAAVIVPSESLAGLSDGEILSGAPGTGPYMLSEWAQGSHIMLDAFDGYWGEPPEIDRIRYSFVPDPVTRRLGLESGQYDFIDMVISDDIPALSENDGIRLLQGGETGSIVIMLNKREGIACDISFRRAVSLLTDRDAIMKACYGDYGYSVHSDYMDSGIWSVDSSLDPYGLEDDERGAELLSESSYNGEPVRILVSNLSDLDKIAITLSSELEKAGIRTELTVLDWAAFMERRKDPSAWDIYVSAASRVLLPVEKGYLNAAGPGGFDDPEAGSKVSALMEASSLEEARDIWKDAQLSLWEYVPVIIPGHYSTIYASSASLDGIDFSDGYHFRSAHLVQPGGQ